MPGRSLQSIADRWAAMGRADGLWCPEPGDLEAAVQAVRRRTTPPSPARTRSPSPVLFPAPSPPSPLLLLPPELWQHVFSTLDVRGLSRAARASQVWRGLAKPMLDEFEVAYVMERMVDAVESGWCWPGFRVMGPLSDSGSDDDDYDMWYGQDLDDREPDGECIGCGAVGVAGGQCLSCGAPAEPCLGWLVPLRLWVHGLIDGWSSRGWMDG